MSKTAKVVACVFVPGLGHMVEERVSGAAHFLLALWLWLVGVGWIMHVVSPLHMAFSKPRPLDEGCSEA